MRNSIKYIIIIFVFVLVVLWDISSYIVTVKYDSTSELTKEMDKLIIKYPNVTELKELRNDVAFISNVCLESEDNE